MGIRINRRMGYALTDFEYDTDAWEATDSRINLELFNGDGGEDLYELKNEFVDWALSYPYKAKEMLVEEIGVETHLGSIAQGAFERLVEKQGIKRFSFHTPLTHRPEFGNPGVLLFQPLTFTDWTRHDDTIDHYDHAHRYDGPTTTLLDMNAELHQCGIYPYSALMLRHPDAETHEEFLKPREEYTDEAWEKEQKNRFGIRQGRLHGREFNMMVGHFDEHQAPLVENEAFLTHLLEDWNSQIPPEILLFAHYSKIFTDFNTVYRLRPVLYTYWA